MSTLLLRFAAPLQAWGAGSKFNRRDTQREPTKSAVLGLVASARGNARNENKEVGELGSLLRFGVRVDREGTLLKDLQMSHEKGFWDAVREKKSPDQKYAHMTYRYYLCDALFLVGLEGDDVQLEELQDALSRPAFPLFLGRRSCPPEGRLCLGIRRGLSLEEALKREPPLCAGDGKPFRIQMDAREGDAGTWLQRDVPLSFDQGHREHGFRSVREIRFQPEGLPSLIPIAAMETSHDAYLELEG